ncbi:type IV secretory system conjugative DNA transfer family protein [Patescibacteria group bacterium]|nr:type IV secretory system conjugative DNA transfer family protein [Patescibacteria group bacterium]
MNILVSFAIVAILILFAIWLYFAWRRRRKQSLVRELETQLFLIRVPKGKAEGDDFKKEVALSEQLFGTLSGLNEPFAFEAAVPYIGQEIHFYAAVPYRFRDVLARQVQALWDAAVVEPVSDYNIFNYSGAALGMTVLEKQRFVLPIATYEESENDTFLSVLGGLGRVGEIGEGAALQIVMRPAAKHFKKEVQTALKSIKGGAKLPSVINAGLDVKPQDIIEGFSGGGKKEPGPKTVDEDSVRLMDSKLKRPLFEVNVRIVASAPSEMQASSLIESVAAGFSQFGASNRNEFKLAAPRNQRAFFHRFIFREFDPKEAMVLTSAELASIFHLPTTTMGIPRVKYLKSREAPPPASLPKDGVVIGDSSFQGDSREVRIADEDRGRHIYLIGQTGTGKSNLLTTMAAEDIVRGKGVAVIDPHGDLVEDVLSMIPPSRKEDVIVFEPGNLARPLGLNMLEYDLNHPEEKTSIVNELLSIFDKLYDLKTTGGPMFEQYMRNALLLLMEDAPNEPATLMEVQRVFADSAFRSRKLARVRNPVVLDFWEKEATKAGGEASLQNITPYVTSKFNNFTANDYMRPIIGQTKSAFNFRSVMDDGKILLVNLAKGRLGDLNANLLGMIIVGKVLMAALSRADVAQEKRRDFYLYIDEFQNFTTDSIAIILSEARKYRLNLTVAHQFIAQLSDKIKDAVFGNVGSMISFRVGPQDAAALVKQFAPVFNEEDLVNIDNFNAYAKLLVHGETTKPFNIRTRRAPKGDPAFAEALREASAARFGRPREEVEADIYKRLRD